MKKSLYILLLLGFVCFTTPIVSGSCLFVSLTNYPSQNPYIDTLRYALLKMSDPDFYFDAQQRLVQVSDDNKKAKIGYKLWMHKQPAPLVFLMPGLGTHFVDSEPAAIAEILYSNGFSVALVSSAFNWEFALNASSSGVPGYTPQDARDIYAVLQRVLADITANNPSSNITEKILAGYSMGGLHAAFVGDIDAREHKINFDRIVALSPPVNVMHGLLTLDEFYQTWRQWSEVVIEEKKNKAVKFYKMYTAGELNGSTNLPVDTEEAQFAIGLLYRMSLNEVIKAIHSQKDFGILNHSYSTFSRQELEKEIERYGYYRYAMTFIKTAYSNLWQSQPLEQLNREASLPAIQQTLRNNPRIFILHTSDDWLLNDYDRRWLENVMQDRMVILNHGGHLGYFYRPDAQKYVIAVMRGTPSGDIPSVEYVASTTLEPVPLVRTSSAPASDPSSAKPAVQPVTSSVAATPAQSSSVSGEEHNSYRMLDPNDFKTVDAAMDKIIAVSVSTSNTVPVINPPVVLKPEDLKVKQAESSDIRKDITLEYKE